MQFVIIGTPISDALRQNQLRRAARQGHTSKDKTTKIITDTAFVLMFHTLYLDIHLLY